MSDEQPEKRKKAGGRVAGTPNKRTASVQAMLDDMGCNPIEAMADALKVAIKDGASDKIVYIADKLAPYYAPKLASTKVEGGLTIDRENAGLQETNDFLEGVTGGKG